MLLRFDRLSKINFSQLMAVYAEGAAENGREFYPDLPAHQQIFRAEQDFYAYLQTGFFTEPQDVYCIWEENGVYISALRLQQYQDGLLLEALETHPSFRKQGYAKLLMQTVLEELKPAKVYSHILFYFHSVSCLFLKTSADFNCTAISENTLDFP